MRKDLIKSTVGLLVIGLIILATFLYGNKQRQDQVLRDQDAKTAQEQPAPVAANTGSTDQAPSGGTAAVHQPVANNDLQNPATAALNTPTPSPTPTPAAVRTPATTPQTGASDGIASVLGLVAIIALSGRYLGARSRLRAAVLHY